MLEIRTKSAEETEAVGKRLGKLLRNGDLVCLSGDLGAGKTAFTGGIAHALGIDGYITSPTFTIVNEYSGDRILYHFDVYRINGADEMFEIGFDEYMSCTGVVVIEWADLIIEILPPERIWAEIRKDRDSGPDGRIIRFTFIGGKYMEMEKRMQEA